MMGPTLTIGEPPGPTSRTRPGQGPISITRRVLLAALVACAGAAQAAPRSAGQNDLKRREQGYRDLLQRWQDTTLGPVERRESLTGALDRIGQLVQEHPDDESRPIWQSDRAGILLFQMLDAEDLAGLFYEFGVPTTRQRDVFERSVGQAYQALADAMDRLFVLQGKLPKAKDHIEKRVNTGRWDRLMNQYYGLKTPYFLGQAALYAALLPDDHAFYRNSGPGGAAARRRQVVGAGIEALGELVHSNLAEPAVRAGSSSLTARLLLIEPADPRRALEHLQEAEGVAAPGTLSHLITQLTEADAHDMNGQHEKALALLAQLTLHPLVQEQSLVRLLVLDLEHRLRVRHAETLDPAERPMAMTGAYQIYEALWHDPTPVPKAQQLESYVYRRWAGNVEIGQDLSQLPPMWLKAASRLALEQADALRARSVSDPGQRDQLQQEARARYERVIAACTELLRRRPLERRTQAEARFYLGLARYGADPDNEAIGLAVAADLELLARQMPDQAVTEQAIAYAGDLARLVFLGNPHEAANRETYLAVTETLIEKYPRLDAADRHRLYRAQELLIPEKRFAEAAELLNQVALQPGREPLYLMAQAELLACGHQILAQSNPAHRTTGRRHLEAQTRRLRQLAEADTSRMPEARVAMAAAYRSSALLKMDQGNVNGALEDLRLIDELEVPESVKHAARGDLIRKLARLEQIEPVRQLAGQLVAWSPQTAAPLLDSLLGQIIGQIFQLQDQVLLPATAQDQRAEALRKSRGLGELATEVAGLLITTSAQSGADRLQVARWRLAQAQGHTVVGQFDEAIRILHQIRQIESLKHDLEVLDALAEASFQAAASALGEDRPPDLRAQKLLVESATLYGSIIEGLKPEANGTYPPRWWHAWMRRLAISDLAGHDTQQIPLAVRQLRFSDPNLGGQPYRSELERLGNKHLLR